MKTLSIEPCIPSLWALNGHVQTVLGHFLPSPLLNHRGKRFDIPLEDGDCLVGRVLNGTSTTVVYLFHGLAGNTDSTYIHRTARLAQQRGHSVIMVNHRGCGEGAGLSRGPYHSGRAEDLGAAIAIGRKMFPRHNHLAVGFSLSGNALLLLLAGRRGIDKPDMAISVNAPIDLQNTAMQLRSGFSRVYDLRFFLECRRNVLYARSPQARAFKLPRVGTLYDFDNLYTAPAGGFRDREDYYSSCSTKDLLKDISIPTLVLTAEDDPFVGVESYKGASLSKSVRLHIEPHGGHMGYISKSNTPLGSKRWQDYALDESMRYLLA